MAFILGNLTPDVNPLSYLSPSCQNKLNGHSYEYRSRSIEKSLAKKGCCSWFDWYRAGKTTHYLADSFTRPHNEKFGFKYWDHIAYEHRLHQMFYERIEKMFSQSGQNPAQMDAEWYQYRHARYIKESKDCLDDCVYILQAVSAFCAKLTRSE